ncbi:MAG: adenylate/guanylate cyclase domain-containing protein [Deltaproteobacteria bacterium]|nr:adenylate/guanylate cyclase domain-containing protein [Deltaproteobacteria bacterium]
MGARTPEELETENAALRAELEKLRRAATTALTRKTLAGPSRTAGLTVLGAEEMILQVHVDDTISYVNPPMATLLGMPDRRSALGSPLSGWDHGPVGERVFTALVDMARGSEGPHAIEGACPGLGSDRLPGASAPRPAGDPILRFTATEKNGRVQVVVQDVTRLAWLEQTFSRYVSPAVIEKMQTLDTRAFLYMERKELTVLFGDLRGFTAMSQELPPEQVQEVVNSFLAGMVHCIEGWEGTVDKFVGDEVMAIFGAPVPQQDHALRALGCAMEMQAVHRDWMERRQAEGKPVRPLGIGLATGEVVAGNVGTETRMDYTVLGHTVNMAARLCGSAEGGEVLTIPATHAAAMACLKTSTGRMPVPRMRFERKGEMRFKNVAQPVDVVSVQPSLHPTPRDHR